jgi:hypothetical protein
MKKFLQKNTEVVIFFPFLSRKPGNGAASVFLGRKFSVGLVLLRRRFRSFGSLEVSLKLDQVL